MVDPGNVVGGGLGRMAGKAIVRRRAVKYAAEGKAEVALRVVAGEQEGVATRWRRGVAALWSGRLDFASAIGGFHPWRRPPVAIPVLAIDASAPRRPAGKDLLSLDANCLIVGLATQTARLELAVPQEVPLEWALHRLWPPG